DPYKVLSIPPTSSPDEIQKAYRQRARETHPDKNSSPTATQEFREVSEAFDILGNERSRKLY
ncbi:DnaJ-like protein, partial [Thalassiosira pseudonana CCMP1335]